MREPEANQKPSCCNGFWQRLTTEGSSRHRFWQQFWQQMPRAGSVAKPADRPNWERRLVETTEDWNGWSVSKVRDRIVVRLRETGRPAESVTLPKPLLWNRESHKDAIRWLERLYVAWDGGSTTLKGAFHSIAGRSDKQGAEHQVTWPDIVEALRESRVERGARCSADTFDKNWRPFLDHACDLIHRGKAHDGYSLLKAALRKWKEAPTMQTECGRYLALFMGFAVQRFNAPRTWLITDFDKAELIPKKPKVRLKAVIDDVDLLDLIQEVEGLNRGWANILRLLTQYGLRPIELQHLTVRKHPTTQKLTFYCSYEKVGGVEETKPRFIQPMFLRDLNNQKILWALEKAWDDGALELPTGNDGNTIKLDGRRVNGFLHRMESWKELINKYAAKEPSEWVRPYSLRDSYSVRSHREGVPKASICASMGHSEAVHDRSYRTITAGMVAADYEFPAKVISV